MLKDRGKRRSNFERNKKARINRVEERRDEALTQDGSSRWLGHAQHGIPAKLTAIAVHLKRIVKLIEHKMEENAETISLLPLLFVQCPLFDSGFRRAILPDHPVHFRIILLNPVSSVVSNRPVCPGRISDAVRNMVFILTVRSLVNRRKIPRSENRSNTLNGWNRVNEVILNVVSES